MQEPWLAVTSDCVKLYEMIITSIGARLGHMRAHSDSLRKQFQFVDCNLNLRLIIDWVSVRNHVMGDNTSQGVKRVKG